MVEASMDNIEQIKEIIEGWGVDFLFESQCKAYLEADTSAKTMDD